MSWCPGDVADLRHDVCYPAVCPAPASAGLPPCALWHQPKGYDYLASCELSPSLFGKLDYSNCTEDLLPEGNCADASTSMLFFWVALALYMFYGLALVCEEFMVPAITVLCDRASIPPHVAGATLLAAGCNAPELISSAISIFVTRSTVGAGTVLGSTPFNLLCICGASALAVTGPLQLDGWLMAREVLALCAVLGGFLAAMADGVVLWWEALGLVALYVLWVQPVESTACPL